MALASITVEWYGDDDDDEEEEDVTCAAQYLDQTEAHCAVEVKGLLEWLLQIERPTHLRKSPPPKKKNWWWDQENNYRQH